MRKFIVLALTLAGLSASAQSRITKQLYSPICNADGSVSFALKAPSAGNVVLSGQFADAEIPMQKGEDGIWTVTITPKEPDIYPYNFIVDGVTVSDPGNKNLFPNEFFKASMLEMPDCNPLYLVQDVPHGRVEYVNYYSKQFDQWRPLVIYLPPSYSANQSRQYPVFYLMSGTTDTEETWTKVGKAHIIADNLIARGRAEEQIIVMPFGYINEDTANGYDEESIPQYKIFERELLEEIMPFVEKNYRTVNDAAHRAISGFSRGGGQSLFVGYRNTDKFLWVCSFSSWLMPFHTLEVPDFHAQIKKLKMHWIGAGTNDVYFKYMKDYADFLQKENVEVEFFTTDHGHTWMHARIVLTETLERLFR